MPFGSVSDFVEVLRKKQLLQAAHLDEITRILLPRFTSPPGLAKEVVRRGWLTVFQINQLFQENGQELILGPYRILDYLGKGGYSQVFKAWHITRNCVVALKVIHPDLTSDQVAVRRFQREMSVVNRLKHPNVVRAYDDTSIGEAHFYAMEFVVGTDLNKLVKLAGPLPLDQACDCVRQVALGLQHAHDLGLIHRDIKPANIVRLEESSQVKILDLGLARLAISPDEEPGSQLLTRLGAMMGTADYVSPEQARDPRFVDIRADIYSLGCTFYYLLNGQPPFPGGSLVEKVFKHRSATPEPTPGLPAKVGDILAKMMAKDAAQRYQTPAEIAAELSPFCPPAS